MSTIKDVARKAGVSIATISNVINNKGSVSDETYRQVMRVIKEMNYRPSIVAKNLKKRKTRFIAVMMPSFEFHYASIFRGIQSVLDQENYFIIPKITNNDPVLEDQILSELMDMDVCGYLVVPSNHDHTLYKEIVKCKNPIIFLERKVEGFQFSAVVFDNKAVVERTALSCFERYGRDQVMLMVGDPDFSSEADCVDGFINACASRDGAGTITEQILHDSVITGQIHSETTFFSIFDQVIQLDKIPKCFIVSNTQVARTLHEVLHILDSDSTVYALDSDEWRESNIERNNFVKIPRNALQLGIAGTQLLLDYIKNVIIFENTTHMVVSKEFINTPNEIKIFPNKKKSLKILALDSPTSDALKKMAVGYKKRFGYEVTVDTHKYSEIHSLILNQIEQKRADHDILMIDIPWISYFKEKGFLYDMTGLVRTDQNQLLGDYPGIIRKSFSQAGAQITGIPIMATVQLLYYRKDLFESGEVQRNFERMYGFDLHPPRTWTEFNIVSKFFNRELNEKSPVEFGTSVCGANATGLVDEFLPRMWSFGGQMVNECGEPSIDSVENIRALKNLKESYKLVPNEYRNRWWDEEIRMLLSGKCAMIHGFSSLYPVSSTQAKQYGDYYSNIGVTYIPGGKPVLGGWMLGINAYCEKPEEAFEYIKWELSARYRTHNALLGWMLPVRSVYENTMLKLERPWMYFVWEGFATSNKRDIIRDSRGDIVDPYWLDIEIAKCVQDAVEDRISSEEALKKMDAILKY